MLEILLYSVIAAAVAVGILIQHHAIEGAGQLVCLTEDVNVTPVACGGVNRRPSLVGQLR